MIEYPDLVTGVYIDPQGRKWFCVRHPSAMNCSSTGSMYASAGLDTFKSWGWKLTQDQIY